MSYDTHCSSCGMPYSDFAREGAKSCECHKMAAQAVRDFVFDKPALSAAPVAQEPVARLCGYCKTWNSKPCGEQCYLQPNDPVWTSPPATPAGTPANRGDRVIYWLKRYQADEHLDDDACEELDALINVLSKGVKVQPSAGVGADEIAQIIATKCFDPRVIDSSGKPFWKKSQWREAQQAANAILLLLSGGRSEQERSQMEGSL